MPFITLAIRCLKCPVKIPAQSCWVLVVLSLKGKDELVRCFNQFLAPNWVILTGLICFYIVYFSLLPTLSHATVTSTYRTGYNSQTVLSELACSNGNWEQQRCLTFVSWDFSEHLQALSVLPDHPFPSHLGWSISVGPARLHYPQTSCEMAIMCVEAYGENAPLCWLSAFTGYVLHM